MNVVGNAFSARIRAMTERMDGRWRRVHVENTTAKFGGAHAIYVTNGVGTVIHVNGKPATEPIKEPEFFSALVKIWLGQSPADSMLKDALLGKTAVLPPNG